MELFKPIGQVEHSGTFNAHLYSVMAGIAFLDLVGSDKFYKKLDMLCDKLYQGIERIFQKGRIKAHIQYVGARFGLFFGIDGEVRNYRQSLQHDTGMMLKFVREMIRRGIYFHDYGGKPCHHGISTAHTEDDIDQILNVMEDVYRLL